MVFDIVLHIVTVFSVECRCVIVNGTFCMIEKQRMLRRNNVVTILRISHLKTSLYQASINDLGHFIALLNS